MSDAAEMAERHGRTLARLSELGLALAERVQEKALAADDPKSSADLGLAFHRIARTVRQSIALEARLVRDAERAERELRKDEDARRELVREVVRRDPRQIARRKENVREAVLKVIWDEIEDEEDRNYFTDLLEQRLEMGAEDPGFCVESLKDHIDRMLVDFSLAGDILYPDEDGDGEYGRIEFDAAPPPHLAAHPPPDGPPAAPNST